MRLKRDSVLIVEAISAEDIGKLPDNSIAESLVRLPGLAGQRLNGCQQVISIRGLAPDFSTALLNGRQQVSAGDNRGVEFDQYPSELLSGMAGARGVLFPDSSGGLPAAETTLAEALQARDYATGLVGKWHLGHLPKFLPTRHGFDRFFGLLYSNDMRPENEHWDYARENFPPLPLFDGEAAIEQSPDQALLTRRFTAKAIEFIERHQARPFFLHLAYTAPHTPLAVSAPRAGKSKRGLYGDVVEELDWSVGEIVGTLRRLGLGENTLVFFTSDNGPWGWRGLDGGSAGLLRGAKGSPWEGGFRVPANVSTAAVASALDLFPTLISLSGAGLADHADLDGVSLLPTLTSGQAVRDELFYYSLGDLLAYRHGPWKLLPQAPDSWPGEEREGGRPLLFDIEQDPSEKHNLADKHPETLARLGALAEQHRQTLMNTPSKIDGILPQYQDAYTEYHADP